ncbi:hypothetical protein SHKM778_02570 [Streptomyces sp. KM77-8]|uniref:Uncharacterized protein n=1 Tax=Streptomyces haneummycinicus TaxID=3074435 RepID=A0AAT9H982_9ACTN
MTVMAERPTTNGTGPGDFEEMRDLLDELRLRDGFKAEVFSMPSVKGYEARETKPFGEKLFLPAPFDRVLDTTGFTVPPATAPAP